MPTRFPSRHHCQTCGKTTKSASKQGHCSKHEWVCNNSVHEGDSWVMKWNEACISCEKLFTCSECGRNEHTRDVDDEKK
ncbi:hypothetical protein C1645_763135 [Glomus cerebriforme]|uniref:C2H2-type domain-containing protein n=1 Tax=Glomus cerebriforme TaxID=658196 RepID=A0A397TDV1_9GLOM|nr:hypothetical protein C1645_763135 [Glomus cerebriforme]